MNIHAWFLLRLSCAPPPSEKVTLGRVLFGISSVLKQRPTLQNIYSCNSQIVYNVLKAKHNFTLNAVSAVAYSATLVNYDCTFYNIWHRAMPDAFAYFITAVNYDRKRLISLGTGGRCLNFSFVINSKNSKFSISVFYKIFFFLSLLLSVSLSN
jgi:hypothetical protein